MKADSEIARRLIFFSSLFFVALIINACFYRPQERGTTFVPAVVSTSPQATTQPQVILESKPSEPPARRPERDREIEERYNALKVADADASTARKAERNAVLAHQNFLSRNLNPGPERKPGVQAVAVAVVSEDGKFNRALDSAIESRLHAEKIEITTTLFKPEFVSDGLLAKAFTNPHEIVNKLELANVLDAILFARQTVKYSSNPSLENVITANMQLEMMMTPASDDQPRTWTLTASGAGFRREDARLMAEERLMKQIAQDPKMSLEGILKN